MEYFIQIIGDNTKLKIGGGSTVDISEILGPKPQNKTSKVQKIVTAIESNIKLKEANDPENCVGEKSKVENAFSKLMKSKGGGGHPLTRKEKG